MDDPIPDDIKRFIYTAIDSVAHLEALLLLRGNRERVWDAETVAGRLYVSPEQAAAVLAGLHAQGFLSATDEGTPRYCYQPRSSAQEEMTDRLAEIYSKSLVAVSNLIHSRPPRVQKFADAFKLR